MRGIAVPMTYMVHIFSVFSDMSTSSRENLKFLKQLEETNLSWEWDFCSDSCRQSARLSASTSKLTPVHGRQIWRRDAALCSSSISQHVRATSLRQIESSLSFFACFRLNARPWTITYCRTNIVNFFPDGTEKRVVLPRTGLLFHR